MRLEVEHSIGDLARDLKGIAVGSQRPLRAVVRNNVRDGNRVAQGFAKTTSGTHGKLYPKSFTWEMLPGRGLFGNTISGVYGPDAGRRQGRMAFEEGPGKQTRPHRSLARSRVIVRNRFARDVRSAVAAQWRKAGFR